MCVCVALTGVDVSPESGLLSTPRGVRATLRSEYRDELDLGKLPLTVFTPEELEERQDIGSSSTSSHLWSQALRRSSRFRNVSHGVC